ncbi:MAG: hypothetical protein NWE98_12025 [Candidatus Bathyarchaeota archaeon]|nr:hypothetical protein [Candidatus Bathyarchaeota archaeon]
MPRKNVTAIFLLAGIAVVFCAFTLQPSHSRPQIGIFYYTWYNPDLNVSWDRAKIIDTPVLGYYNSCDPSVIRQHLLWMEDLGIDFVVVSWWGNYDSYGVFIDNATKQVFDVAESIDSKLKFFIMVEPFNHTGKSYDYNRIYNYIYFNYVRMYPSLYYYKGSKPTICFYNDDNLTSHGKILPDARFNTIIVGQKPYSQWIYTNLNKLDYRALGDRQVSVTPRYDESNILERIGNVRVDVYLNESTYYKQWENALQLWENGEIDTILISSWNEYPERTAIEPHIDATAVQPDHYYLYDKTKEYMNLFG